MESFRGNLLEVPGSLAVLAEVFVLVVVGVLLINGDAVVGVPQDLHVLVGIDPGVG